MAQLTRTRVGRFKIEDAVTLAEIEQIVAEDKLDNILVAPDTIFDYNKIIISESLEKLVLNGNMFRCTFEDVEPVVGQKFLIYDCSERFVAIYEFNGHEFAPVKMFL